MLILRAGLYISVGLALYVAWASHDAGYPVEMAIVRGVVAFMACAVVVYLAELVVMTAPPATPTPSARVTSDDDSASPTPQLPNRLPAVRTDRSTPADERRAV